MISQSLMSPFIYLVNLCTFLCVSKKMLASANSIKGTTWTDPKAVIVSSTERGLGIENCSIRADVGTSCR